LRIHIIGGSGSGKSYLAELLCQKYNIKHYDLDDLFWLKESGQYGIRMPEDRRTEMLSKILATDGWVMEGVYFDWLDDSFTQADRILLLDTPLWLCRIRICRRFLHRRLHPEERKNQETWHSFFSLLKWTAKYQRKNMPLIRQKLHKYTQKVTVIHTCADLSRFADTL
jgi:adenylate kinase family enzyme